MSIALGDPEGVVSLISSLGPAFPIDVIADATKDPGPAHAVGRLSKSVARSDNCLVTVAVDQLRVRVDDLEALRDCAKSHPNSISVASGPNGRHWVFASIPYGLAAKISRDAESVNSLQSLYLLNEIHDVAVMPESLIDVNTRSLLPGVE